MNHRNSKQQPNFPPSAPSSRYREDRYYREHDDYSDQGSQPGYNHGRLYPPEDSRVVSGTDRRRFDGRRHYESEFSADPYGSRLYPNLAEEGIVDPLANPDYQRPSPRPSPMSGLKKAPPPPSFERSMSKEKQDMLYGPAPALTEHQMIQVAPGVSMRLRGAAETWKAVERDFYIPCDCFECSTTILCIQDAECVVCPICRVVSPVGSNAGNNGGVGLGFTMEDLVSWQEDMVRNMQRQARISRSGLGYY